MAKYANDPAWADVIPIPHDDGGPNPLASIAYTDDYRESMSYLRAIMADNEVSERALALTEDIININPAHYTIWIYRANLIRSLPTADARKEVQWLNDIALKNLKNYQIWHHRQLLIDRLDDCTGEIDFVNRMLDEDAKNYHVWSYRQWLVCRFGLWSGQDHARETDERGDRNGPPGPLQTQQQHDELDDMARLIDRDVRNNSAWNHRFFLINARPTGGDGGSAGFGDVDVRRREVGYARAKIALAPQNQSPWSYLRGLVLAAGRPLDDIKEVCDEYATLAHEHGDGSGDEGMGDGKECVKSRHALDLLAEIYAHGDRHDVDRAKLALDLLATKYDPIRADYWAFKKGRLLEIAA